MTLRKIVEIDEDRCDGCGLCIPNCAEGALAIVDGKARLVSDVFCDGLGACLGHCPRDAIRMVERDAAEFDEEAVHQHMAAQKESAPTPGGGCPGSAPRTPASAPEPLACGCPGSLSRSLTPGAAPPGAPAEGGILPPSRLANWPVQIALAPVNAPWLQEASLLIAADCVPFAFAGFHQRFLGGKVALVGCPKLDDAGAYRQKLARILALNDIRSVEVVHMEVPCCGGLVRLVAGALADSGKEIPATAVRIGVDGRIQETRPLSA